MRTRELVESIVRAKSSGEEVRSAAYRTLAEKILYVPLHTVRNSESVDGGKKVRFLTLDTGGTKRVPAFSTEDLLFDWSSGDHQFLPVAGADLVMMLPHGLLIELDIGTNHNLLLSRQEMDAILETENEPFAAQPLEETRSSVSGTKFSENSVERNSTPLQPSAPQVLKPRAAATESEIEERVRRTLLSYPAVVEAYYLGADEDGFGGLLGLLVSSDVEGADWNTEQRFSLVEDVAEASRELFGYAGAIEVYDDLANESSRSWDLFKSHKLFYRKEDQNYLHFANSNEGSWSASREGSGRPLSGSTPGLRLKLQDRK